MADDRDDASRRGERPAYTLYRSKPRGLRERISGEDAGLEELRGGEPGAPPPGRPARPAPPRAAEPARTRRPRHRRPRAAVGRARGRRLARALARAVPRQRADRAGQGLGRGEGGAQLGRLPAHVAQHDPDPRLRRAPRGLEGAGREPRRAEPQRHDHAVARRRRARGAPLDPARHDRRHPRPRAREDQRRLRVRRRGAVDPHDRVLPRDPDQPPRRGRLHELPEARRRARRRRREDRPRLLADQRRARATAASRSTCTAASTT